MADGTEDEDDADEVESELDHEEGLSLDCRLSWRNSLRSLGKEADESFERDEDPQARAFREGGVNKQLTVSKDRSYVEKGGKIGVFKHSDEMGELQYIATINKLVAPKGKAFAPKKARFASHSGLDCSDAFG